MTPAHTGAMSDLRLFSFACLRESVDRLSCMHRERAYQLAMCTYVAKTVVMKASRRAKESIWHTSKTGTLAAMTASYRAHDAVKR